MLTSLSSDNYQSGKSNPAFLLHSTGHWPAHSEIDASIIYADYYYIEALLRLKRLQKGKEYWDRNKKGMCQTSLLTKSSSPQMVVARDDI